MMRSTNAPSRVRLTCDRLRELLGQEIVPAWERSPIQTHERWFAKTPSHIAYIAHDRATSDRIVLEARRLRWAGSIGIPVPPLVQANEDFLVYRRVPTDPLRGGACIDALCVISQQLEGTDIPPPGPLAGRRTLRRSLVNGGRRYLRLLAKGIDLFEFRRVTRAVRSLPCDTLSHGAFHSAHVLHDESAGLVRVVDWEHVSYQPRFSDLFYLWPTLEGADDRACLLEHITRLSRDPGSRALVHLYGTLRARNRIALLGEDTETIDALLVEVRQRALSWRR